MKAITPVIATILVLLITISIAGFSMIFFQRTMQTSMNTSEQALNQQTALAQQNFEIINVNQNKVDIMNHGTGDLSGLLFYVDGTRVDSSATVVPQGQVGTFTLNDVQLAMLPGKSLKVAGAIYQQEQAINLYAGNTVAYYTFDNTDGRTIPDDFSNGNTGTFYGETWHDGVINGATVVPGKYGNAMSFNGASNYVNIGNLGSFYPKGTIEFWMNPSVVESWHNPFTTKYSGGNAGIRFEESTSGAFFTCIGNDTGTYACHTYLTSGLTPNTWYHVGLTWDTAFNTVSGYLNGAQEFSESNTLWPATLPAVTIGEGFDTTRYWKGLIDEVRIYSRALNQSEIQADMNSPYPISRTVGSWSFDHVNATHVLDTHNIVAGKYGAALSFDGVNDYVNMGNGSSLDITSSIAVEAWIYASSNSGWLTVLQKGTTNGYRLKISDDNKWAFNPAVSGSWTKSSANATTNIWVHLVGEYNGSVTKLYVNGIQVGSTNESGSIRNTTGQNINIGSYNNGAGQFFNGTIDEVRILNIARSMGIL